MHSSELPNEMLEKIFSYISHGKDLQSCRLVDRRWNSVATNFWRNLPSTQAQVRNKKSMSELIEFMNSHPQGQFPFHRIRFKTIHTGNIKAANALLMNISGFVEDIHISEINRQICFNRELFQSFIDNFDISLMPNLVKLRIDKTFSKFPQSISLEKLQTLEMPERMNGLSNFLIKSAPNLKLFKTCIEFVVDSYAPSWHHYQWKFCDKHRQISVIELKLKVYIMTGNHNSGINFLVMKLNEWKNIKVKDLSLEVKVYSSNEIQPTTNAIQELIDSHAETIIHLKLEGNYHVNVRDMPNLETLAMRYSGTKRGPLEKFQENLLPHLRAVELNLCHDCDDIGYFLPAVFETVRSFTIIHPSCSRFHINGNVWTDWHTVFPNLESLTYIVWDRECIGTHYFPYLFSRLQGKSIKQIKVEVPTKFKKRDLRQFTNTLSGFADFGNVMRGAVETRNQGVDNAEDAYWIKMEATQRSCLNNLPALSSLYLDLLVDEDFLSGIIARLKPLHQLSIYCRKLHHETWQKLIDRHGSVVLLHQKAKKLHRRHGKK